MPTETVIPFLQGATAMGSLAVALCFLRFHRRSGDRLFLMFALGFLALAGGRVVMLAARDLGEVEVGAFAIRAVAFAAILVGIIDKNRKAP